MRPFLTRAASAPALRLQTRSGIEGGHIWLSSLAIRAGIGRAILAGASILAAGCGSSRQAAQPQQAPAQVKAYAIQGVVTKVDAKDREVTIKHEAIPGYMPAMTMPFAVKDRALLEDLQPGDEVRGTLEVGRDESALSALEVTRPATSRQLSIDLSGGMAQLKPREQPLEPGQPVPDFAMTTQDGKTLHLADLRGHVVVLTFIYTRCPLPEFCPLLDRKFRELAGKLSAVKSRAEQVRLLSVSFDPEHDTPEVLRKHARNQGAEPPLWRYAVASHDELRKVAPALGLLYLPGSDEISHSLSTAVIDADGRLVRLEKGRRWEVIDLFKTVVSHLPQLQQ